MKVDVIASEAHYLDHMLPIFDALPKRLQGMVHDVKPNVSRPVFNNLALVAGMRDVDALTGRLMIYVEHGAGQAYLGDEKTATHPSYSGGGSRHPRSVIGYVAPSLAVASRWGRPAIAAGSPKMDRFIGTSVAGQPASVCIAWHWDCRLSPETRTALPWYEPHLRSVVASWKDQGFEVLGHAHPRWKRDLDDMYDQLDVEVLRTDTEVFQRAHILVMDNSSLMYEFAMLDRPVVAMNAPWYRKDIEHGLRFWSHVPGRQVDEPYQLADLDLLGLCFDQDDAALRREVVADVYAQHDRPAAEVAAQWIADLIDAR